MRRPEAFSAVNQIAAASDVHVALSSIDRVLSDPTLAAVRETDVFRLRRGLCLPSAAATCINAVLGRRIIGETRTDAPLTIGDIFRLTIPYHGRPGLTDWDGTLVQKPWYVVTPDGHMYHQVLIALAKALEIEAISIAGFPSIQAIEECISLGGKAVISLDNRFVLEKLLKNDQAMVRKDSDGKDLILIDGPEGFSFRYFEDGRHAVAVLSHDNGRFLIHDSFSLPQLPFEDTFIELSGEEIDQYLHYATGEVSRGIVFAADNKILQTLAPIKKTVFVPKEVIETFSAA